MIQKLFLSISIFLAGFLKCFSADTRLVNAAANTGIHTFARESVLKDGYWVKIYLQESGVYQLTDTELRKMGFSNPAQVAVYGFGGALINESFAVDHIDDLPEIPVYRDDAKSRTLFYAQGVVTWDYNKSLGEFVHTNNFYANQACYFLHQKDSAPLAMAEVASAAGADEECTDFNDYYLHENDNVNIGKTGREMYGEDFTYTTERKFKFYLSGIVAGEDMKLTYDFVTKSTQTSKVTATWNGQASFPGTLESITDGYARGKNVTVRSSFSDYIYTDNTVSIKYEKGSGNLSYAYLNYIRLNVKRKLASYGAFTMFRNTSAISKKLKYRLDGYASQMQVWDVTNPQVVTQQTVASDASGSSFVSPNYGMREYAWLNLSQTFMSVDGYQRVDNQNLHALSQTDMVIIVSPVLQKYAEELARYRRDNDQLSVHVVTPEQIYNEFSSGTPDGTAYRLFMKMFYDRAATEGNAPRYLLLFGDGAYDNRGLNTSLWKSSDMSAMLLTYQSENSLNEVTSYVCDDYFGFLDDDEGGRRNGDGQLTLVYDKLDIGIGRLPVRNATEAGNVLNKILSYSDNNVKGSWKNQLLFLADDGDSNIHMRHGEDMTKIIEDNGHNQYMFNKVFLDAFKRESSASGNTYPTARKAFLDQLNSGSLLVNYSGHANTNALTGEKMFDKQDASSIKMKKLPVWITATCEFGRFDDHETSAGEMLLLNPDGGAIALFTTTRIVYADRNKQINAGMIENIFAKDENGIRYRLGDVMRLAKASGSLASDINKLNFSFLGDPSLTLSFPEQEMEITHINGQEITDEPLLLKALSRVTVRGRVLSVGSNDTDMTFNGVVSPTLFDCEETVETLDNDNKGTPFSYTDRSKRLFAGQDNVADGEFEFTFIVPKDISYSMENGLLNLYASSDDGREANGYFDKFLVGGTTDEMEDDIDGPEITALYLNSDNFRSGDAVNTTPYLFAELIDETAINTSGVSIGHDITATITGNGKNLKYVLNSYFIAYSGQTGQGSLKFSIPELEEGEYELELKAWDVYNNSSTHSITFVVKKNIKPSIIDLTVSNNPARDKVVFHLYHNFPETTVDVKVQVYSQMGQCLWQYHASGISEYMTSFPIEWDLTTNGSARVNPGIYIYRANVSADGNNYVSKSKKLIVLGQ